MEETLPAIYNDFSKLSGENIMNYLALDLGGSSVKYGILNEEGEILHKGKTGTSTESLEKLGEVLSELRDSVSEEYDGVAVSMPGRIDTAKGTAHTGGAYSFIDHTDMKSFYESVFQKPVVVANDGKCAAAAESWKGSLKDVCNGAVIVIGTGIGGGIILNHEVFMGSSGGAGEFSWLTVDYPGVWQPLEYGNTSFQSIWSGLCSSLALIMGYQALTGKEHVDGITFFQDLHAGNETAEKVFDQFTSNMAAGISGLQAVLDLECYAIGGGISEEPIVRDAIAEKVDALWKLRPMMPYGRPSIVTTKYHNDANLIGALHLYLKKQNH